LSQISSFFKIRAQVRKALEDISPDLVVLGLDNDPIAQQFIRESKTRGIRTVLVQEALIRPHEYTMRKTYFSDYLYRFMRFFGVYLSYTKYGTGDCDKILVGGRAAAEIMTKRGVSQDRIAIVGYPKYDLLMERIGGAQLITDQEKVYLFAASTKIVQDHANVQFLKRLVGAIQKMGLCLIVKLHPRGVHDPQDIYEMIEAKESPFLKIVKEGDDTFELLKRAYALVTVSSTVILDALMMNKECIVANYLAGESRLEYAQYDAIHMIENEDDIYDVIKRSISSRKSYENKKRLLNDELYSLDGKSGDRAAGCIEAMINGF
jgi:hypothetical protein